MKRNPSRSSLAVTILIMMLAVVAGAPRAAEAGVSFSLGAGFTVGGVRFHLGVHDDDPAPYYRVDRPLYLGGARCSDRCYIRDGYHYHHDSCPLVRSHLRRYGYVPAPSRRVEVYGRYAPAPYLVVPVPYPYRRAYPTQPVYRVPARSYEVHDHGRRGRGRGYYERHPHGGHRDRHHGQPSHGKRFSNDHRHP